MAYPRSKKLTSAGYSPTRPSSETDIRTQIDGAIQECYDMLELDTDNNSGSHYIGVAAIPGVNGGLKGKLYTILAALKSAIDGVVLGEIPDSALTDAKLSDAAGQAKGRISDIERIAVSIEKYGASDEANFDNISAINAAITNVYTMFGGGKVNIPPGTWYINPHDGFITLKPNTTLCGKGTLKVIDDAGSYAKIIYAESADNCTIEEISIDQNPEGNTTCDINSITWTDREFVIYAVDSNNLRIQNINIHGGGVNFVLCTGSASYPKNIWVCNNKMEFIVGHSTQGLTGIGYDNTAIHVRAINHHIKNNIIISTAAINQANTAIESHGGMGTVSGNIIDKYRGGVIVAAADEAWYAEKNNINVTQNVMTHMQYGVRLENTAGTGAAKLDGVVVANNNIHLSPSDYEKNDCHGVFVYYYLPIGTREFHNILIQGNNIHFDVMGSDPVVGTDDWGQYTGVRFNPLGNTYNVSVQGNKINNAPGAGIYFGSGDSGGIDYPINNGVCKDNIITNTGIGRKWVKTRKSLYVTGKLINCVIGANDLIDGSPDFPYWCSPYSFSQKTTSVGLRIYKQRITAKYPKMYRSNKRPYSTMNVSAIWYEGGEPQTFCIDTDNPNPTLRRYDIVFDGANIKRYTEGGGTYGTLAGVTASGVLGETKITVNDYTKIALADQIKIGAFAPNVTGFDSPNIVYIDTALTSTFTDSAVSYYIGVFTTLV